MEPEDTAYRELVLPFIDALRNVVKATANLRYLGQRPTLQDRLADAHQEAKAALETWDELSEGC